MPLDLKKILSQLGNLENQDALNTSNNRINATYNLLEEAFGNQNKLLSKVLDAQDSKKANFYFAIPELSNLDNDKIDSLVCCDKNFSLPHITLATDGSQINPSAHEFTSAFLINIGFTAIPYHTSNIPVLLTSEPAIYNSTEDINPQTTSSKGFYENIQEEEIVAYERTLQEIESLVKLAKKYISYNIPIVALLDGTLIHWHIERFNNIYIERFIKRFTDAVLELKSLNIPLASFLSNSRSNDFINMLRLYKCPYETIDCKKYCNNIASNNLPCNPTVDYKPVLDRRIIEKHFIEKKAEPGTRTILFKSNSKILNHYSDDLKVFFFYLNTGTEIARVELPSYVAKNTELLNLLHNAVSLQCKVGFGYPVTLSEAHLQAIVNRNDRQIFFDLVKNHLLKSKQISIKVSTKEFKKRISFV